MQYNISEIGNDLELKKGFDYIIIDALYLGQIKEYVETQNKKDTDELKKQVKEKVFPYDDAPFAEIFMTNNIFKIEAIKKIGHNEKSDSKRRFASDTGVILIFQISHFQYLIEKFSYDELTDSKIDLINYGYWSNLIAPMEQNSIAAVIAPGIGSGFDFEGSGLYRIDVT